MRNKHVFLIFSQYFLVTIQRHATGYNVFLFIHSCHAVQVSWRSIKFITIVQGLFYYILSGTDPTLAVHFGKIEKQ